MKRIYILCIIILITSTNFYLQKNEYIKETNTSIITNFNISEVPYRETKKILPVKEKNPKEIEKLNLEFYTVDISKVVNMGFYDKEKGDGKGGWIDRGDNDIRRFDFKGKIKLHNILFKIIDPQKNKGKSCIVLRGRNRLEFPTSAEIAVDQKGAGIYFLHNAAFSQDIAGRYHIIYENGKEEIIELLHGRDVFDWWYPDESKTSRIGWISANPKKNNIGLNIFAWVNPYPKLKIKKIIAETDGDKSFLMLVAITLVDKGPYLPHLEEQINTQGWYEYEDIDEEKVKGTPLDVSFLLDPPAGKYGFIKVKGDKFYFANGTEARFWGINIVGSGNFPDKDTAEWMVDKLARMGVNITRHHHMDADWFSPNIFGNSETTRKLDENSLERFDYLWYLLKKRGIYLYIDLTVSRVPKPEDEIEKSRDIAPGYKVEGEFDTHLIDLQKEYAEQLLTHRNPYTGTTLAEDPAVVFIDIINEDSLFWIQETGRFGINTEYYRDQWQKLFNQWLLKKTRNSDKLKKRWQQFPGKTGLMKNEDPEKNSVRISPNFKSLNLSTQRIKDTCNFMYETQYGYYQIMRKHLRALGVKCPIAGSNHWVDDIADLHINARLDFVDRHYYWAYPVGGYSFSPGVSITQILPMVKNRIGGLIGNLSLKRVFGKPYVISEWNSAALNQYYPESIILMAVFSRLNNWNALQFAFTHSNDFEQNFNLLNIYNQPAYMALWPIASLLFHRKDLKESKTGYFLQVKKDQILNPFFNFNKDVMGKIGLAGKTGIMFSDIINNPAYNNNKLLDQIENSENITQSSTKEIIWDISQGLVTFNTRNSQGIVGFISKRKIILQDVEFNIKTDFAVVVLTSLTDEPINTSKDILLTAVSRARPSGLKLTYRGKKVLEKGELPFLVQPVEGEITIKSRKQVKVFKLSTSGELLEEIPVIQNSHGYSFHLSAEDKGMHYQVTRE